MIKILYFISTLSYSDGVTSFVLNLVRHIDLNEFKVTILCSNAEASIEYLNELKTKNIDVHFTKNPNLDGFSAFLNSVKDFFREFHDFDILHCNTTSTGAFVLREAKLNKVKIRILHAHATKNAETFFKNIRNSIIKRIALHYANKFFACSNAAGNYLFGGRDFTLIHNAIDYKKFTFNATYKNEFLNKFNLKDDTKIVGFVGRFTDQKNPEYLIKIINGVSGINTHLFILGSGKKESILKDLISKSPMKDNIHLIGEVNDTYKWYSFFDALLLPSIYEGLPMVGIECQVAGCFLFCSDKVTEEVKISDNVKFLKLNNLNEWVQSINDLEAVNRSMKLSDDYDINCESIKVQQIYRGFLNNEKDSNTNTLS